MKLPANGRRVTTMGSLLALLVGGRRDRRRADAGARWLEPMTIGYYGSDATLATFIAKEEGIFREARHRMRR